MTSGEKARRPLKVVILVVALWLVGGSMQSAFGQLLTNSGLVESGTAAIIGQVVAWGLLFLVFLYFRRQLDLWLRT